MLKKQYLISGVILLLAVALILVYFLFLREEAAGDRNRPLLRPHRRSQGAGRYCCGTMCALSCSAARRKSPPTRSARGCAAFWNCIRRPNDAVSLEYGSPSDWPDAPDADAIVFAGKAETDLRPLRRPV